MDLNRPIETVSWEDAQKFVKKLNEIDPKYNYRLPTDAEWEFAARGGTTTAYSFGNNSGQLKDYGWYSENSDGSTQPVAVKKPNPSGLYDVHGNVWQWTEDWYTEDTSKLAGEDPKGPTSGSDRVIRGGCWGYGALGARSALRYGCDPSSRRNGSVGFRLVRTEE